MDALGLAATLDCKGHLHFPHLICRAKVGCCHSEGEAYDDQSAYPDVFAEVTSIGLCTTSERYFAVPISYEGTSTKKIGTFTTSW